MREIPSDLRQVFRWSDGKDCRMGRGEPAPQTVRRRGEAPLPFGRISGLRRRFLLRAKDGSGPASAPEGCGTNACGDCPLALRDCGAEPDRGVLCRNFGERKTGGQWGGMQRTGCTGGAAGKARAENTGRRTPE